MIADGVVLCLSRLQREFTSLLDNHPKLYISISLIFVVTPLYQQYYGLEWTVFVIVLACPQLVLA